MLWNNYVQEQKKINHGNFYYSLFIEFLFIIYSLIIFDYFSGCLPLVLAVATMILRTLHYPLLPHQTVHRSLCQLIGNTSTLLGKYSAVIKNLPEQKNALQTYIRKIGNK